MTWLFAMFNALVLHFWEAETGRALSGVVSEITGISDRTLRKPWGIVRQSTLAKAQQQSVRTLRDRLEQAGNSEAEITSWISKHPMTRQPGALYAALVYEHQYPGVLEFPHTVQFAATIDRLSSQLFETRQRNDICGFKQLLLETPILDRVYFENNSDDTKPANERMVMENLRSAKNWAALDSPFLVLSKNILFSLLAHLDVEFCSQYFSSFQARSCFAMLLPRLDPAVGEVTGPNVQKRRGMFWLPVRRLIDFIACIGAYAPHRKWPSDVISVGQLVRDANEPEQNLVNWRDGTKAFTWSDFARMWHKLYSVRNDIDRPLVPSPLFVAATLWQLTLVSVSTTSKVRSIVVCRDEYLLWWERHQKLLAAEGCTNGTTPWPTCFNQI